MSKPYLQIINKSDSNKCNCVLWARQKCASLPFGLITLQQKKNIINDHTPRVGSVAIMNVGFPWGHVGVITFVGKQHITIREANYKSCTITERHDTTAGLKIIGYFNPDYKKKV